MFSFDKNEIFLRKNLRILSTKLSAVLSKMCLPGCRTCIFMCKEFFHCKITSLKKCHSIIFGHWVKNFLCFVQNSPAGTSKLHSICPEKQFNEDYLFSKNFYFSFFSDNEQKNFSFLSERKRSFQNCILRVFANFWGKLFWETLFLFLSVSYNIHYLFWPFSKCFSAGLSQLNSTCP